MTSATRSTSRLSGWIVTTCLLCAACEDAPVVRSGRGVSGGASSTASRAATPGNKATGLSFKDDDFVESERHRDPFRNLNTVTHAREVEVAAETQRMVIMPETAVEQMRLIAVITGLERPKAMLVDGRNVGYVVQRGDYVGRPKVFQTTGSVAMTLNWRVDRIRDDEIVLTQQDPSDPGRPPLSRIIGMHSEVAAR